ncbi:AbrB/MazE/SpoVT family DNA-binding domain-containing protein [Candidatus Woesearchaeota archaeon]|nr:AbrB/MazE/SpoVT family DNA-binding domain-containing protein [Candidatus Woesearchaeota archaeon]
MVELKLVSQVSEKGQVVIPKPIRHLLNIRAKNEVTFSLIDGRVVLEKKKPGEILKEFFAAGKPKLKAPKHIDWDALYSSQFT